MPWRVAFALQADGWWLRSDVIWAKPNPMPESVTDRPTRAHEYLFLLTKSAKYWYDADAIREPGSENSHGGAPIEGGPKQAAIGQQVGGRMGIPALSLGRNKRSVWTIATEPYPDAHFAAMPTALVVPCVLAGSPPRCCPACGAPWARVVERVDTGQRQKMADGWDTGSGGHGTIHRNGREAGEHGQPVMANVTTGCQPTCRCGHTDTVPGVVLDLFVGSGTTLLVALRHGRRGIGFDASEAYCGMARARITGDSPLFNTPDLHGEAAG